MKVLPTIKLYGTDRCHKTHYYQSLLDKTKLPYQFLDVIQSKDHAEELRGLYTNRKLNFPTITIGKKKLRNPHKDELYKWINKLVPKFSEIRHDKDMNGFNQDINSE